MPYDISMCGGDNCPKKQLCYRFTAEIVGRQDFFGNIPFDFSTNSCEMFWKDPIIDNRIRKRAYEIWETNGRPDGESVAHWQEAEREILEESATTS
jgi:hypothetical protein